MREILIDYINDICPDLLVPCGDACDECDTGCVGKFADHLLANGVIVPPFKVGQTVWVYNGVANKVFQNTVISIKFVGKSWNKNTIETRYINKFGEPSCRKFAWAQMGKQVFFTKEEAEAKVVKEDNERKN